MNLPENFKARMQERLRADYPAFLACYESPPVRGLRVNTIKIAVEEFLKIAPFALTPSNMISEGFVLEDDTVNIGRDPYHFAGLYYMQEPSAMRVIDAMGIKPHMRVLDLCAAPGGKSGGVAARLDHTGLLVSNEMIPSRARALLGNMERMGATNAVVTHAHPDAVCAALCGFFDAVLVDAPCSGEGMFRRDEGAVREWSIEHVNACAKRQKAVLQSAQKAVAKGGALVYSTCTFAWEENEEVVRAFLDAHTDFELQFMQYLYPHECRGEGHFMARMVREGTREKRSVQKLELPACKDKSYLDFISDTFITPPKGSAVKIRDGRVFLIREELPASLAKLRILSAGVHAGKFLSGRFEPGHALFMAEHGGAYARKLSFDYGDERLLRFLSGETLPSEDAFLGYCAIAVSGFNVGFGKASQGVMKNHIPKGLRFLHIF